MTSLKVRTLAYCYSSGKSNLRSRWELGNWKLPHVSRFLAL